MRCIYTCGNEQAAIERGDPPVTLSELGPAREWVYAVAKTKGAILVVEELDIETGA